MYFLLIGVIQQGRGSAGDSEVAGRTLLNTWETVEGKAQGKELALQEHRGFVGSKEAENVGT